MPDDDAPDAVYVIPEGTPIRFSEWAVFPMAGLLLGTLIFVPRAISFAEVPNLSDTVTMAFGLAVVALSIVLALFGYQAYRDLTERSTKRFLLAGVFIAAFLGVLGAFSVHHWGLLPLVGAGCALAGVPDPRVRRVQAALSDRVVKRLFIWGTVAAAVSALAFPVVMGLGSVALILVEIVLAILAPVVAAFAYTTRTSRARETA
jgi:hypothetical protein